MRLDGDYVYELSELIEYLRKLERTVATTIDKNLYIWFDAGYNNVDVVIKENKPRNKEYKKL